MRYELTDHDTQIEPDIEPSSHTTETRTGDGGGTGGGSDLLTIIAAAGLGAAAMYFLDPARGRRRRHVASDKLVHAANVATDAAEKTSRDVANRTRGLGFVTRRRFTSDDADDIVIAERVRAEMGRVVSHPRAVIVTVDQGVVTLAGPILAAEAEALISRAKRVRGVKDLDDRLERHEQPGNVPALQGRGPAPAPKFELMQENWTPAARLMTTLTGGALAAAAMREGGARKPLSAAVGLAGLALAVRGATNMPLNRLVGAGAGRRAVTVNKSITISASPDDVFGWLTEWESWPQWMSHVREVRASGPRGAEGERTHWTVDGPAGTTVSWEAITTRLARPDVVAWETVEGSPIAHAGEIRFIPTDDGLTRVDVQMSYNPIAGAAGHAIAALFGRDPKHQLDDDLVRLKATIETGHSPRDAAVRKTGEDATLPMSHPG